MSKNFAITGVAGYIAPRHLKAISETGNRIVAAADPNDSVGILDQFAYDIKFFPEIERFDRHLDKLRRGPEENRVHYVTICSPNYLHDAHIRLALRNEADVICEKPLVINPWNLDALAQLEEETGRKINTILQLRVHPALMALKAQLESEPPETYHDVVVTYITGRGPWYLVSWKGLDERSGGLATNIGVHFFDLLIWLFGPVRRAYVNLRERRKTAGTLELERARIRWYLSVDVADLPVPPNGNRVTTYRSITIDGKEIEFTQGFGDLHTRVYERTLRGEGFGIEDARPSIELVHAIRTTELTAPERDAHPSLAASVGRTYEVSAGNRTSI
jgi:UDP-N-acetyl-2-amino-2-deoxyglucuronate dehydrogenase